MRDQRLNPVAVVLEDNCIFAKEDLWTMGDVIGQNVYYAFEAAFPPYAKLTRGEQVDKIDVVVYEDTKPLRPLEVKLTVLPDSSTVNRPPSEWAPEMVMRPVSSAHAMMSIAKSLNLNKGVRRQVERELEAPYKLVKNWDNEAEIGQHYDRLSLSLSNVLELVETHELQQPFLLQPLWRTVGQTFQLAENCFDIFVWSDAAVIFVPVDQPPHSTKISRTMRETVRHVRALYDLLTTGDYSYQDIYKGMPFGQQTDKSFSLSGKKNRKYLAHPRLVEPLLPSDVVYEIVIDGGELELKPERRFDAAVQSHMSRRA